MEIEAIHGPQDELTSKPSMIGQLLS